MHTSLLAVLTPNAHYNSTTPPDVPCTDADSTRTAFEVFSTCVSTMFICVWSAFHIEVPTRKRGALGSFGHRLRWMVLGVFMPPWMLYLAASQLINAARLLGVVYCELGRDVLPRPPDGWVYRKFILKGYFERTSEDIPLDPSHEDPEGNLDEPLRVHPWTLTHAFFAVMGGYVVDTTESTSSEHRGRFVLTPRGVAWMLQNSPELIPDVSEEDIKDRSKVDTLAKLLSLSQVLYFCVSCADRGVKHLPLSLLEVVTLAHAFCTVMTYIVWLKKPFSIMEPTVISGSSDELKDAVVFLIAHTPAKILRKPKPRRPRSKISMIMEAQSRSRQPRPPRANTDALYENADSISAFRKFPFLAHESSLPSMALSNRYDGLEMDAWRAGALSACMILYALPHFLGWYVADPDARDLWHWATAGLLVAGLVQALVLCRVLEPTACIETASMDGCAYAVSYLYHFLSISLGMRSLRSSRRRSVSYSYWIFPRMF